jgi:hypothetical protein
MFPIFSILLGVLYAWYDETHNGGGYGGSIMGMLWLIASIIFAVAFIIGHFT